MFLFCFFTEKDEQQHRAEVRYPRMHFAGDAEDNKVPRVGAENVTAHNRLAQRMLGKVYFVRQMKKIVVTPPH